jgi:hypothetical protein
LKTLAHELESLAPVNCIENLVSGFQVKPATKDPNNQDFDTDFSFENTR